MVVTFPLNDLRYALLRENVGKKHFYWSFVSTLARIFAVDTDEAPYDEDVLCNLVLEKICELYEYALDAKEALKTERYRR